MIPEDDQALQRWLDRHELPTHRTEPDAHAYRRLYEALETPPSAYLPADFAETVVARATARHQRSTYWSSVLMIVSVGLALVLSALAIYHTDIPLFENISSRLLRTKEVIIFILVAFTLVQLGDRWLIKKSSKI